ncbi:MAG: hypothetical protein EA426_11500 [Spirochaetaceae bacterium]|nr:MAG: hypothetical protein EA426_11500 [Spirochaetaceae bacterium]
MMFPRVFALVLATAVLVTSILIFVMGARFQKVEQAAYSGARRPWWFIMGLIVFAALYIVALVGFIGSAEKTWAGWVLMVVIPVGAALKGGLVILNKKGQQVVTSIEGDAAWRKIALARAVLLPIFLVLAYYV